MRSKEVRDLALAHVEDGTSTKEIAKFLKVSERTVRRWKKVGPIDAVRKLDRVNRRCLTPIQEEGVLALIEERPGILLEDVIDVVSQRHSISASRLL